MHTDKQIIINLFSMLEASKIDYVLLRNINNELPERFRANKDIDILVKSENKTLLYETLKVNGWKKLRHPWDYGNNFVFLYAMDKLDFFEKGNIYLDICYQLCCRSINQGEWMPLDQYINNSVWANRKRNTRWNWYELSTEDEMVHLLTRCILDKKTFTDGYQKRLDQLSLEADMNEVKKRLLLVFFSYTEPLIGKIAAHDYVSIIDDYMTFCSY